MHALGAEAPTDVKYLPAAHAMQFEGVELATTVENLPAWHIMQLLDGVGAYWPGTQVLHDPLPPSQTQELDPSCDSAEELGGH